MITGGSWLQSSRKEKTFLVGRSFFYWKEYGISKSCRKCGYVGNLFYMKVWRSLWEKWLVNCGKGVLLFHDLSMLCPQLIHAGMQVIHISML